MKFLGLLSLLSTSLLPGALAHTIFVQLEVDGTTYGNYHQILELGGSRLPRTIWLTQVVCLGVGQGVRVPTYDGVSICDKGKKKEYSLLSNDG